MSQHERRRIEDSLELDRMDDDLFRSKMLWKPAAGRGAFGGNIIAQAAHAATQTCYFIGFGNVDIPSGIIYHVDRLRNGKSYSTRSVRAIQQSNCIFTLLASFHKPELNQIKFQSDLNLSLYPKPEECMSIEEKLRWFLNENSKSMKPKIQEYLSREIEENMLNAIEFRSVKVENGSISGDHESTHAYWIRSRVPIRPDPAYQKLVLAYASDFRFIGSVSKALGLNARGSNRLAMMASLDHSMFFYDHEVDVSQWMLYHMEVAAASFGRGLVIGRIYNREGKLLVVCTQEGVVRAEIREKGKEKL
ncbi:HotDog domain-containing protein [Melampsora americana]|nr:HotDog domain-containing protein [Melampsora americana]